MEGKGRDNTMSALYLTTPSNVVLCHVVMYHPMSCYAKLCDAV